MTLRRYGAGGPQRARVATSCGSPQPAPGAAPVRPGVRDHGADPVDPHRDAEAGPEGPRAPAPVHTARAPYVGAPRARPGCPRGRGVPDGLRFPAAPEGRSSAGATAGSRRTRRPVARGGTTRGVDGRMWTGAGGRARVDGRGCCRGISPVRRTSGVSLVRDRVSRWPERLATGVSPWTAVDAQRAAGAAHRERERPPTSVGGRFTMVAGVPGLEPRTTVPETAVLPITPYPKRPFGLASRSPGARSTTVQHPGRL